MLLLLGLFIGLCSLAIIIAGLLSYLRNPEKLQNRWFFALSISVGFWTLSNFIGSNIAHPVLTELAVKFDFCSAIFMAWCLLEFVSVFIVSSSSRAAGRLTRAVVSKRFSLLTLSVNIVLSISIFFDLVVVVNLNPALDIQTYSTYYIYIGVLIFYIALALGDLLVSFLQGTKQEHQKLSFVALGFSAATFGNVLSNIVFPSLFEERSTIVILNNVGYTGIFLLVLCLYLAITTRKLFDIRFVIARSLAYVLAISTLAISYVMILTAASFLFISKDELNSRGVLLNFAATLLAVLTFPILRRFFNKLSNKLFFRDNYEIQEVVNDLTAITTTTLDMDKLFNDAGFIFQDSLKSAWCTFVIQENKEKLRGIGDNSGLDLKKISKSLQAYAKPHTIIQIEDLEDAELRQLLQESAIEIVAPMHANQALLGFILFGTKQNGSAYTQNDIKFLNIAADALSVAAQNALRFEEIKQFNITLQQKVEDATRDLRTANEKLKKLDQTKDDFISMASHQLRTPLTSVKGYVSMVLEGDTGKITAQQRKLLDQAFISSQRMVYLIADLLNVSRLKTGKFIIEAKPTNLADVVEGELAQLTETAKARDLELIYKKPKNFPTLMLDDTKIRQVIMNFADNAIYYTPAGGHITVGLADKGETIEFTVVDDGIGVPKSEQHHLFNKFYRAGNAKKARPDGTGLGLFMAKKVIIAQGGSIIFKTEEGKGSTFGFSFAKSPLLQEHFKPPKPINLEEDDAEAAKN